MSNKAIQNMLLAFIMGIVLMIWGKAEWNEVAVIFLFAISAVFGIFTAIVSEIKDNR